MAPIYYKGAHAVCLVYDSTNQDTFESLSYWVDELSEKVEQEGVVVAVVASKIDYVEAEQVKGKRGKDFAQNINAQYHQTSAKDGTGINQLYQQIADKLYINELSGGPKTPTNRERSDTVNLKQPIKQSGTKTGDKGEKKKGCC